MQIFKYYLSVCFAALVLFSCSKGESLTEKSERENTTNIQETILNFKNEAEFYETLAKVFSFSIEERKQWAVNNIY